MTSDVLAITTNETDAHHERQQKEKRRVGSQTRMRNIRLDETLMWLEYHAHARTQQWGPRILRTETPECQWCESVTFIKLFFDLAGLVPGTRL